MNPQEEEGMSVADKVKSIIVEQLGVEEDEVTLEASFTDDLGADSLDIVELVMAFEEEFGLEIPDEEAEFLLPPDSNGEGSEPKNSGPFAGATLPEKAPEETSEVAPEE